jgi:hypothetical protein
MAGGFFPSVPVGRSTVGISHMAGGAIDPSPPIKEAQQDSWSTVNTPIRVGKTHSALAGAA